MQQDFSISHVPYPLSCPIWRFPALERSYYACNRGKRRNNRSRKMLDKCSWNHRVPGIHVSLFSIPFNPCPVLSDPLPPPNLVIMHAVGAKREKIQRINLLFHVYFYVPSHSCFGMSASCLSVLVTFLNSSAAKILHTIIARKEINTSRQIRCLSHVILGSVIHVFGMFASFYQFSCPF